MIYKNYIIQESHEFINIIHELKNDQNFLGGNVTMPFKQTLVECFGDLFTMTPSVKNTASANTIFRDKNGDFKLENTDLIGIKNSLKILCSKNFTYENAIVFGGGGASASCIYAIFELGLTNQITCFTRDIEKAHKRFLLSPYLKKQIESKNLILENLNRNFLHYSSPLIASINDKKSVLIINTLPLGKTKMYPEPNNFCSELLTICHPKNSVFFDLVYAETDACLTAKEKSIPYLNGMLMFETQAAHSFKLWTGIYPESN